LKEYTKLVIYLQISATIFSSIANLDAIKNLKFDSYFIEMPVPDTPIFSKKKNQNLFQPACS